MLSNVRNPNAPATNRWTVTDVAAHIAGNLEVCTAMVRGVPSPAGSIDAIGALNDLVIATLGERDINRLGEHIEAHAAAYIEAISSLDGDPMVPWHAHLHVPASTLAGLSLGETIVHGLDIARATDQAWPVRRQWARTVIDTALPVLPHYLKPDRVADRRMRFEIRLRGSEPLTAHLRHRGWPAHRGRGLGRRRQGRLLRVGRPVDVRTRDVRPLRPGGAARRRQDRRLGPASVAGPAAAWVLPRALTR